MIISTKLFDFESWVSEDKILKFFLLLHDKPYPNFEIF